MTEREKIGARHYIDKYHLLPHPEGGWYTTVLGDEVSAGRPVSSIYYLLQGSEVSAFHRLHGVTELWYYHAGEGLDIHVIDPDGGLATHRLSPECEMQVAIEPGQWFAAEVPSKQGFCLVGCAVAPAFTYGCFELARRDDLLAQFPQHSHLITRLC